MKISQSTIGFMGIGTLIAVIGGCNYAIHNATMDTVTVQVTDKDRITTRDSDGNQDSKYLIFTETETFENTDSLFAWKFDSSDVYGRIQEGDICRFRVNGWRNQFFSSYRNILEAHCEKPQ
jgi:hypothetical protein